MQGGSTQGTGGRNQEETGKD